MPDNHGGKPNLVESICSNDFLSVVTLDIDMFDMYQVKILETISSTRTKPKDITEHEEVSQPQSLSELCGTK